MGMGRGHRLSFNGRQITGVFLLCQKPLHRLALLNLPLHQALRVGRSAALEARGIALTLAPSGRPGAIGHVGRAAAEHGQENEVAHGQS